MRAGLYIFTDGANFFSPMSKRTVFASLPSFSAFLQDRLVGSSKLFHNYHIGLKYQCNLSRLFYSEFYGGETVTVERFAFFMENDLLPNVLLLFVNHILLPSGLCAQTRLFLLMYFSTICCKGFFWLSFRLNFTSPSF